MCHQPRRLMDASSLRRAASWKLSVWTAVLYSCRKLGLTVAVHNIADMLTKDLLSTSTEVTQY